MSVKVLFLVALTVILVGCKTTANISPPPIAIPEGFSESYIKTAILMATIDKDGEGLSSWQQMTDSALSATLRHYSPVENTEWFFE